MPSRGANGRADAGPYPAEQTRSTFGTGMNLLQTWLRKGLAQIGAAHRSASDSIWDRLAGVALAAAAVLVLLTFTDYGVTWDEDVHNWYGILALNYYLSLFADQRALDWLNLYNYGAAFDMVAAALNRFSPLGVYETRHLLNGFVGILGLAGCWKLGRALGGPRAGFFALIFLLLTPNYYGPMFNNPKDIPFAVGGVWATYYMVRILPALPRPKLRLLVKMGLAIGLALGVRVGGLLFLCYLGLLLALSAGWQAVDRATAVGRRRGGMDEPLARGCCRSPRSRLRSCWCSGRGAQHDPIGNPLRALAFFSHETFPFNTLFDGRFVPASDLPWEYLPTYILLALPELILVLLIAAPVLAAIGLARTGIGRRLGGGARRCSGSFSWALRSSFRWPTRSPSRRCCSTACATSSLCCRRSPLPRRSPWIAR